MGGLVPAPQLWVQSDFNLCVKSIQVNVSNNSLTLSFIHIPCAYDVQTCPNYLRKQLSLCLFLLVIVFILASSACCEIYHPPIYLLPRNAGH
jgi:hypothetical protein